MVVVLACLALLPTHVLSSEPVKVQSSDLKSVYIFNFIRFTDWPAEHLQRFGKGITLNVLYDQKIHDVLQEIAARPVGQKYDLKLQSCKEVSCLQNSSVLYIGESDRGHFEQLLKLVDGYPVLTISDVSGFAKQGGMIEIKHHNKKLTFVVNLQAVKRAGLYISAQLLQLGEVVGRDNE